MSVESSSGMECPFGLTSTNTSVLRPCLPQPAAASHIRAGSRDRSSLTVSRSFAAAALSSSPSRLSADGGDLQKYICYTLTDAKVKKPLTEPVATKSVE
eukprot:jgi/Tetstr1/463711/TSEL_008570.t1